MITIGVEDLLFALFLKYDPSKRPFVREVVPDKILFPMLSDKPAIDAVMSV